MIVRILVIASPMSKSDSSVIIEVWRSLRHYRAYSRVAAT
ncbi:Uncharacterized protein ToN1_48170 [Aromatoleum petrolei]|nr:Uncharacterized protein ToN1_48170 [Aromatoleum petrolei]